MGVPTKRTDATHASSSAASTPFKWNAAKEQALWLIFDGKLSQAAVAQNVAVSLRTLDRWIAHPVFKSRLEQMRADLSESLKATLYVSKESRILALADLAQKARREFERRPVLKEVRPTRDGEIVNESFNEAAFAAFRGALDDIAKEQGQRKSQVQADVSGEIQHTVTVHYVNDWRSATFQQDDMSVTAQIVDSIAAPTSAQTDDTDSEDRENS